MVKRFFSFIAIAAFALQLNAQISYGGKPRIETEPTLGEVQVPFANLEKIDNAKYIAEDMEIDGKGHPYRLSVMQEVNLSNKTDGVTTRLPNGDMVWRLGIRTEGAEHTFPIFSKFDIPEGAELFIYNPDMDLVLGGFNIENTNEDGGFYSQALPGDEFIIEYYEPAEVAGQGTLEISQVAHGYKGFLDFRNKKRDKILDNESGSCQINVACSVGSNWADQKRSVVLMYMTYAGYGYMCTGAMINNTRNEKNNYMLSANHCISDFRNLTSVTFTFYFNAQTSTCSGSVGQRNQSLTGATKLANYSNSDFLLMKINSNIPSSYNVYCAGWTRSTSSLVGCCIHHPNGDWKKISIPNSVQAISQSGYTNFWYVKWKTGTSNQGCVEGGSSGSPLFNANKLIIGQLQGGKSDCAYINDASNMYDMYGRFDKSWTGGGTNTTRLSYWLAPNNSGATSVSGMNYNSLGIETPEPEDRSISVYPNPSGGLFNVEVPELGVATYTVYDMMGRQVLQARTVLSTQVHKINLSGLHNGAYRLEIDVNDHRYVKPILINK